MLPALLPEILTGIVTHLTTAKDVASLALVSKDLNDFVQRDGWRTFVGEKFPSIRTTLQWKREARALTTLSRNIDRRGFFAADVDPRRHIWHLPSGKMTERWHKSTRQTIGFQAFVDSWETTAPDGPWDRKEFLVWAAGADLVCRTSYWRNQGEEGPRSEFWDTVSPNFNARTSVEHQCEWTVYSQPHYTDGTDDITSVKILKPEQAGLLSINTTSAVVLVGRASGNLELVSMSRDSTKCLLREFDTNKTPLRSVDLSGGPSPLIAAGLADGRVALFPLLGESSSPLSDIQTVPAAEKGSSLWSARFLSQDTIALGQGPSNTLVRVYKTGPSGLSNEPLRTFTVEGSTTSKTSAYPVAPLPGSLDGSLFWSGGYDGIIRLHDMRSPDASVLQIEDTVDNSSIFALETIGRERVIAGSSNYGLIKVFDLRMAGGRAYSYLDAQGSQATSASTAAPSGVHEGGFNIFMNRNRSNTRKNSPVYSLSRPSPTSDALYIGLENRLVQLNFTSLKDEGLDPMPILNASAAQSGQDADDYIWHLRTLGPLQLSLYEQNSPGGVRVLTQAFPGWSWCIPGTLSALGYDERLSEEGSVRRSNLDRLSQHT